MRRIKSDTLQSMAGLWLAYLLALVLMHRLQPGDPWTAMITRPVSLVVVPLLVACIPALARKPKQVTGKLSATVDSGERSSVGTSTDRSDIVRRMVLVWLVSLAVFAFPFGTNTLRGMIWAPIFHKPIFLILAPLLLACIPLLFPSLTFFKRYSAPAADPALSRSRIWNGIVSCSLGIVMAIGVLLLINDSSLTRHDGSSLWPNVFFTIWLIAALWRGLYFVKLLKRLR